MFLHIDGGAQVEPPLLHLQDYQIIWISIIITRPDYGRRRVPAPVQETDYVNKKSMTVVQTAA